MPSWISLTDIKLALRAVRKQPLLSFTSALALATGIGLATTGFTVLDAVLFSRLPFAGGDRFVAAGRKIARNPVSSSNASHWNERKSPPITESERNNAHNARRHSVGRNPVTRTIESVTPSRH